MRKQVYSHLIILPFLLDAPPPIFLISINQYILITLLCSLGFLVYLYLMKEASFNTVLQERNDEIAAKNSALETLNKELELKNTSLDLLNKKLISEIGERENIEKFSFARDRFVANISGQMRISLNNISNLSHLLLDASPREDQAEALHTLQYSANELVVFINDILDFSKIEAGKVNLSAREFNPIAAFTALKERFEVKAKAKGLLFNLETEPNIPTQLIGDQARMVQITASLLSNMIHQTDEGMVDVHVSVQNPKWSTVTLKITVSGTDKGKGLQDIEALQHPIQVDFDSVEHQNQHLTLAIAKRLVELQNGTLEVQSRAVLGTSYLVSLPFKNANSETAKNKQSTAPGIANFAGHRILLVEDNKVNQLVVSNMLRKLGMEVTTADNGLQGLEAFDKGSFDLILMDIQMPEMDGYRATAEIRRYPDPAKSEVPIIALTASAFLTAKEKAKLFGMNDHVGKPFSPDELLEKISACLEYCKKN